MTLRTRSIYDPAEKDDGLRVLVTRYYPRGVKKDRFDSWVKDLSPSVKLLRAYRDKRKSWEEFGSEFVSEVRANPAAIEALQHLRAEARNGTVTLLCYERGDSPCHRTIVADLIRHPKLVG